MEFHYAVLVGGGVNSNSFNILYYFIHTGTFKLICRCSAHLIVTELNDKIIRAMLALGFQDFSLRKVT